MRNGDNSPIFISKPLVEVIPQEMAARKQPREEVSWRGQSRGLCDRNGCIAAFQVVSKLCGAMWVNTALLEASLSYPRTEGLRISAITQHPYGSSLLFVSLFQNSTSTFSLLLVPLINSQHV